MSLMFSDDDLDRTLAAAHEACRALARAQELPGRGVQDAHAGSKPSQRRSPRPGCEQTIPVRGRGTLVVSPGEPPHILTGGCVVFAWPMPSDIVLAMQFGLAGALAAAVGWQRHHAGRPAGIRTHALVAMAAAAFTAAGAYGFTGTGPHDPLRVAAQVVSGIGFLGAGTIVRARDHVYGLTTAATLWLAAALGMLVAVGLGWAALFATVLALGVLSLAGHLEGDAG